jgi:hypothetical protein
LSGMIKMRAPEGFTSMAFNGRELAADVYGNVEVRRAEVEHLTPHGFVEADGLTELPQVEIIYMSKRQLIQALLMRYEAELNFVHEDDLRVMLASAGAPRRPAASLPEAPEEISVTKEIVKAKSAAATRDDVATMHRWAMFRFLKDNNVDTKPAMKDKDLRELAYGVFDKREAAEAEAREVLSEIADTTPSSEFPFADE